MDFDKVFLLILRINPTFNFVILKVVIEFVYLDDWWYTAEIVGFGVHTHWEIVNNLT